MNYIERYDELYEAMSYSADPAKMRIFGEAEKWAFRHMVELDQKAAEKWLEKIEAVDWNNYLSRSEAEDITAQLLNQDGKRGPVWTYAQVESAVNQLGGKMSLAPYYNCWALFATMNMLMSDHAQTLQKFVGEADIPNIVYQLAVEKLTDPDRTEFIRSYFSL